MIFTAIQLSEHYSQSTADIYPPLQPLLTERGTYSHTIIESFCSICGARCQICAYINTFI